MKSQSVQFLNEIPEESDDKDDIDYKVKKVDDNLKKSMQNRNSFPTVASVSLRFGASDRVTAAIATAALIDAGLITEEDSNQVLDHHKVHREKQKYMENLRTSADQRNSDRNDIKCIE